MELFYFLVFPFKRDTLTLHLAKNSNNELDKKEKKTKQNKAYQGKDASDQQTPEQVTPKPFFFYS
jgi:hypothetical protein